MQYCMTMLTLNPITYRGYRIKCATCTITGREQSEFPLHVSMHINQHTLLDRIFAKNQPKNCPIHCFTSERYTFHTLSISLYIKNQLYQIKMNNIKIFFYKYIFSYNFHLILQILIYMLNSIKWTLLVLRYINYIYIFLYESKHIYYQ